MAFKIIPQQRYQKWFPIPGDETARVLVQEDDELTSFFQADSLIAKLAVGKDIRNDLERGFFDAIAGWEDVVDENGEPLPCDSMGKRRFLSCPGMLPFLRQCRDAVAKESADSREAAQKNY